MTIAPTRDTDVFKPKLNDEQRGQIRAAWAKGAKQTDLARQFGVTQSCISKVVEGIPKVRAVSLKPKRCCVNCGTPLRYKTRCEPCNRVHRNEKEKHRQRRLSAERRQVSA